MKLIQSLISVVTISARIAISANASAKGRPSSLDATEASHLTFMREEEKLARDVHLTFADMYPDQTVFSNIATSSEQTHNGYHAG